VGNPTLNKAVIEALFISIEPVSLRTTVKKSSLEQTFVGV
jgi:hypothetical protein